jgi:hypothetical protein
MIENGRPSNEVLTFNDRVQRTANVQPLGVPLD